MKASKIIKELKTMGYSKYRIAKTLDASWQSVYFWERDIFQPNKEYREKLEELIKKKEVPNEHRS